MALSWPRTRLMCPHASMGERRSSATSRSILLRTRSGVTPSSHACRSTAAVCTHTPSTTSTTSSAPSLSRTAEETSEQKSTWPGESIRFTRSGLAASAPPPAAATDKENKRLGVNRAPPPSASAAARHSAGSARPSYGFPGLAPIETPFPSGATTPIPRRDVWGRASTAGGGSSRSSSMVSLHKTQLSSWGSEASLPVKAAAPAAAPTAAPAAALAASTSAPDTPTSPAAAAPAAMLPAAVAEEQEGSSDGEGM
mmetsp:Transcript_19286/g.65032  ORF Transcript_19286/g.65032 Transcript_19286/m.65032 type:complete len:254 (-) Transcript_19286:118-879(-)